MSGRWVSTVVLAAPGVLLRLMASRGGQFIPRFGRFHFFGVNIVFTPPMTAEPCDPSHSNDVPGCPADSPEHPTRACGDFPTSPYFPLTESERTRARRRARQRGRTRPSRPRHNGTVPSVCGTTKEQCCSTRRGHTHSLQVHDKEWSAPTVTAKSHQRPQYRSCSIRRPRDRAPGACGGCRVEELISRPCSHAIPSVGGAGAKRVRRCL